MSYDGYRLLVRDNPCRCQVAVDIDMTGLPEPGNVEDQLLRGRVFRFIRKQVSPAFA
jgi:hypothetical protein